MNQKNDIRNISIEVEGKAYWVDIDKPRTIKELAFFMKRHRGYISAMRKAGFEMPLDPVQRQCQATLAQAYRWLTDNPEFTYNGIYKPLAKIKARPNNTRQHPTRPNT